MMALVVLAVATVMIVVPPLQRLMAARQAGKNVQEASPAP